MPPTTPPTMAPTLLEEEPDAPPASGLLLGAALLGAVPWGGQRERRHGRCRLAARLARAGQRAFRGERAADGTFSH